MEKKVFTNIVWMLTTGISCALCAAVYSPGPPVSSTNKTDHHHITEILLKVVLNTIKQNIILNMQEKFWHCTLIRQQSIKCKELYLIHYKKYIFSGISYLTPEQEGHLREILQNKHREVAQFSSPAFTTPGTDEQSGVSKGPINIPDEQKNFVKQTWWVCLLSLNQVEYDRSCKSEDYEIGIFCCSAKH